MFQGLEYKFQDLVHMFQGLEYMFQGLEYKIIHGGKTFSPRSKKKYCGKWKNQSFVLSELTRPPQSGEKTETRTAHYLFYAAPTLSPPIQNRNNRASQANRRNKNK